jgi:cysteine-rich repeat protein
MSFMLIAAFVIPHAHVLAQSAATDGLTDVGDATGLGAEDPRIIVAKVIRTVLGFLGVIAVVIVMYAGFVYMTAAGNEEKVAQAKRTLLSAGIGLLLILFSFAISSFVISALTNATDGNGGSGGNGSSGGGVGLGGGSSSLFSVTGFRPEIKAPIRNIQVRVTFSKNIDSSSALNQLVIRKSEGGETVDGATVVSGNTLIFTPSAACPSPNEKRFCFDEMTDYTVTVLPGVKSTTGTALTCSEASPCTSTFRSGDLIDVEPPRADMTLPDDGSAVPTDSLSALQVFATDDAGISVGIFSLSDAVLDTVPAEGDIREATIESLWDTSNLTNGARYKVVATVIDLAGNTDEDAVTVTARPFTCFNGIADTDLGETGPDCGGDPLNANYCGACDGSSCQDDAECGSGSCTDGVCQAIPEITDVSPENGAPGTYVTISGNHFGKEGSVMFKSASGEVKAELAPCGAGWSDEQVIVRVPDDAITGSLKVTDGGGASDETDDDNGIIIDDFLVDDTRHPGLCSLDPKTGAMFDTVKLTGTGFGVEQGSSRVLFGTERSSDTYTSWSDDTIAATVAKVENGKYSVSVEVGGELSNPVTFTVRTDEVISPTIVSLTPAVGAVGNSVSLSGANFGEGTGIVHLKSRETGDEAVGSLDFPSQCSVTDPWKDTFVQFIVPQGFSTSSSALLPGEYDVYVENQDGGVSNTVLFTVDSSSSSPSLCGIDPNSGAVGDEVTMVGRGFGSATGVVTFSPSANAAVKSWKDDEVVVTVPSGTASGEVSLTSSGGAKSNGTYFVLGSSTAEETVTLTSASYAWSFSTGIKPKVPELVVACSAGQVSGVPNARFTEAVCVNAVVYAEFTETMNEATLDEAFTLERCTGSGTNPCSSVEEVAGKMTVHPNSFTFIPSGLLETSSTYRVTVSTEALSVDGTALPEDAQWSFVTKDDTTECDVESVVVSPSSKTLTVIDATQQYTALPVAGCVVVDSSSYSWDWTIDESYARFASSPGNTCQGGSTACVTAQALAEGKTPVTAEETGTGIKASGNLTVNFTDPYITNVWPECDEACLNAAIGADFNTSMNAASVEGTGRVVLYQCGNELCTSLTEVSSAKASCTRGSTTGSCRGFSFPDLTLAAGAYYRVIVSKDVMSESGVKLTRGNYGSDYSWSFRVRTDGSACAVNRVSLSPSSVVVNAVGERTPFTSEAYGAADSCSPSGQRLSGFDYNWAFTSPISDEDNDSDPSTRVADWYGTSFVDSSPSLVGEGCTSSCTSAGSAAYEAICGDGTLDTANGEECEDGNVASGDGCSASCLREGAGTYGVCGNGSVERAASGAGEDCDDGNATDGDGCSSTCLAEGSRPVGATCGNGDVAAVETTLAGEECDDSNAVNGDGCSSLCVHEGTPTLASIGNAVCSDGIVDAPSENCDDGNTKSGDGCSSSCLLEGSSSRYAAPSVCGNGKLETGEECEDGDAKSGDGCSEDCLLEGSSIAFAVPSVCGDGITGEGENALCESRAGADGNIDPLQLAVVTNDAVFEVDEEAKRAVATIEVREVASGLVTTADLTLLCAASDDNDCNDPATYGVGTGNCCMERPTVTLYPSAGAVACRNTAVYGTFSEDMDISSFSEGGTYKMYASLSLSAGANCPETHTTLAVEPKNVFARALNKIFRLFTGDMLFAATSSCVLPIDSYEAVPQDDGTTKVYMHYTDLFVAGGTYTLVLVGDEDVTDGKVEGVRSAYGVGLNGQKENSFTVGTGICALDAVSVEDTDEDSPYLFTEGEETHTYSATGLSYAGSTVEEIESVPGAYSWKISSWVSGDKELFTTTADEKDGSKATVATLSENGETDVVALASIEDDVFSVSSTNAVSGSAKATAYLCENPWPKLSAFPWSDDAAGGTSGLATEGSGWMNFSTHYCRDAGEEGGVGDLPEASVINPPVTKSEDVIKEYLFEIADGSGDAIGIRVVSNGDYLSPQAWYEAQGFSGRPSETVVDGYAAVRDGRTTYVSAPNVADDGTIYSNIYVISYNEGASSTTKDIYDEMLANLSFNVNVSDITLCVETDGTYTSTECSSDLECGTGTCGSVKAKLRRDTKRLSDMTDIATLVDAYGEDNGSCSRTTSKLCSADSECPSGETCEALVPVLSSGTAVRAMASSVWSSWNEILGGAVQGTLPTDPLNVYDACGEGTAYEAYASNTCVDESRGAYVCPEGSHAYHYRSLGPDAAYLYTDLEYQGAWAGDIDEAGDNVTITVGNSNATGSGFTTTGYCDGKVLGTSATCGDGVIGGSEICELGQRTGGGDIPNCDSDDDGIDDAVATMVCNSTCSGFEADPSGLCLAPECGNGVVDGTEECDDGSYNGKYGYCSATCDYDSAFYCGDGSLAGGEVCDCGNSETYKDVAKTARSAGSATPGTCGSYNGVYNANASATCAWDCSGPAAFCGDGHTDSGETCDGDDESWDGELCSAGSTSMIGQPCTSDTMCGTGGTCGNYTGTDKTTVHIAAYDACPTGTTRVRTCNDSGAGATCTYLSGWAALTCTDIGACGDGVVDPDEECDDGNTDSTDSCTSSCKENVCGDGAVYAGEEECDEGGDNGSSCSSLYGSTCTSCSVSCRNVVSSGDFCGDGVINGTEFCDGSQISYTWFDSATNTTKGTCTVPGATRKDGANTFTCRDLGVCNGGAKNGEYCTSTSLLTFGATDEATCGSGSECVKPACADNCTSSCPLTFAGTNLLLTANQPGSDPDTSVLLYDYDEASTSKLPNAATITVPACTAVKSFTANLDLSAVEYPDVYVALVTDRSGSMDWDFDGNNCKGDATCLATNRISVAREVLTDATTELYDELGALAHIGLVGYSTYGGSGMCSSTSAYSCSETSECDALSSGATCKDEYQFYSETGDDGVHDEVAALDRIAQYTAGGSTHTDTALTYATKLLSDVADEDNVRKIIVLLSDGDPSSVTATKTAADAAKAKGYEVYTLALTTSSKLIANMKSWSSNNGEEANEDNGIDYAYDGSTAESLAAAYEEIIKSITGITLSLVTTNGSGTITLSTDTFKEGPNQTLPWPENFKCDGVNEQSIPVQITFGAEGQIELSDVRLNYCSP